jgi:WD40 repeat protein/tRNA A-37 threonylcarbamoyl transferase component Bud32
MAADPQEEALAERALRLAELDEQLDRDTSVGHGASTALPPELGGPLSCLRLLRQVLRPGASDDEITNERPAGDNRLNAEQIDRFQILDRLGRGGFNEVLLAFDPQLRRQVALKIPRLDVVFGPELRKRFVRDARAVAGLSHPGIAHVYEVCDKAGQCWIASEYCSGGSLAQWLKGRSEPVPAKLAARLGLQVAEAAGHAHERGILHRDLKPSNLLFAKRVDESGPGGQDEEFSHYETKLIDFGLAHVEADAGLTSSGAILGTPAYMAPEQAQGRNDLIDVRTDVYGLGALLYEVVTGRRAFLGATGFDACRQVISDDVLPPRRLRPDLPGDLEAIILKCLEKERARRYAGMPELIQDLKRFLSGQPTVARSPTPAEHVARWIRRHRSWAALAAVVALGLGLGIAGNFWHMARLSRELAANERLRKEAVERARRIELEHYAIDIRGAQLAWNEGRGREALALLSEYAPAPGREDLRDFAWGYLWRSFHQSPLAVKTNQKQTSVCFSPDGSKLAVSCQQGSLLLVDARAGRTLVKWSAHVGNANDVAFSADGESLYSAGDDGFVRMWRLSDRTLVAEAQAHQGDAFSVAVSPVAPLAATGGADGLVRLWKLPTLEPTGTFEGHSDWVRCVEFTPDGERLASCGHDGKLSLWNLDGSGRIQSGWGDKEYVLDVSYSPDGSQILAAMNYRKFQLIDSADLKGTADLTYSASSWARGARFTPDGKWILSGADDGVLRVWSAASHRLALAYPAHEAGIKSVAMSPDGLHFATVGDDCTLRVWTIRDLLFPPTAATFSSPVFDFEISRDGRTLAAVLENRVEVLDRIEKVGGNALDLGDAKILGLSIAPDGSAAAAADSAGHVHLWSPFGEANRRKLAEVAGSARDVAFDPTASRLIVLLEDGTLDVWDVKLGSRLKSWRPPGIDKATALECSPWDGRLAILASSPQSAVLVDSEKQRVLGSLPHAAGEAAFTADGLQLLTGMMDNSLCLWDLSSQTPVLTLGGNRFRSPPDLTVSPDGTVAAAGTSFGPTYFWSLRTGDELLELSAREGNLSPVVFTPDGKDLLAGYLLPDATEGVIAVFAGGDEAEKTAE